MLGSLANKRLAVCGPSSCSEEEITDLASDAVGFWYVLRFNFQNNCTIFANLYLNSVQAPDGKTYCLRFNVFIKRTKEKAKINFDGSDIAFM